MRYGNKVLPALLINALIVLPSFAANNFTVDCPGQIQVQQAAAAAYAGWRSLQAPAQYYLSGVTFYSGKPEEMASLKPEEFKKFQSTWRFSPDDQIYLVCEYNQTSIQLTRALPVHTKACTVQYNGSTRVSSGGFIPKQIRCALTKMT
ncbi:hypothetical protein AQUSIP_23050 [Aquicella siphonis]|uniref:Uncharacterized protein n=1 Tax=Aquicella siphonis TaxID=254247 RepID=A0A5E4PKC4_9COXI|nr:STY0301 family protein [Aquicella siphonis]VVC76978.1 hypothetical protein AQUSIP_23050 [Aquicella siphonis]